MDERLQRIEREGTPVAKLRARRQAGWSEEEAWRGLVTPELPYADALELGKQLEGLRFLEVTRQRCGDFEGETGRFAHEATGLVFRLIPGGRFLMGSREGVGEANERPQREVRVRPFLLCETTCTQAAWDRIRIERPSSDWKAPWQSRGEENLPRFMVSWEEAHAWCVVGGLRLPSEAEWEYACRAGSQCAYGFGDSEEELLQHGWFFRNSGGEVLGASTGSDWDNVPGGWSGDLWPVAAKRPNAWGLYDMHGNAREWCQDTWSGNYEGAPTDGAAYADADVSFRVYRGGSYRDPAPSCRSANRGRCPSSHRDDDLSFRPVRSLP